MIVELELAAAGATLTAAPAAVIVDRARRRRRHERTLRHIAELELELGIARPLVGLTNDATLATRDAAIRLANVPPGRAYDGPALTDEDVRRLEHPDEFR